MKEQRFKLMRDQGNGATEVCGNILGTDRKYVLKAMIEQYHGVRTKLEKDGFEFRLKDERMYFVQE